MREKGSNSPVLRGLEIIRESLSPGCMLSPSRVPRTLSEAEDAYQDDAREERELSEVCSLAEEADEVPLEVGRRFDETGLFACFGSYRQRHGETSMGYTKSRMAGNVATSSGDAPNGLGPSLSRVYSAPINWKPDSSTAWDRAEVSSPAVDISRKDILDEEGARVLHRKLQKQRSLSSNECREEAIEEAWERRRDRILLDELNERNDRKQRAIGRSVSDCGDRTWPRQTVRTHSRTRSLTDEDLDELRGCIDLGFRFSDEADPELCSTLPALELCYAIARQFNDVPGRSSPVSTLDSSVMIDRSANGSSSQSSPRESWRIASPGDHPSQVKTRLRHWAQAVACNIRQSC